MLIVMDRDLSDPAIPFTMWPNWQEFLQRPASAVTDHPWSNRGAGCEPLAANTGDVEDETERSADKGKEKAIDVSTPVDSPLQPSVVEDVRGRWTGRGRWVQSRPCSQPRTMKTRGKSVARVNSDQEADKLITVARPSNAKYDLHNPSAEYLTVVDSARCDRCIRQALPCGVKEDGRACYQCMHTKHACSHVISKHGRSCSVSRPPPTKTCRRQSPSPGPSKLQPPRTNAPWVSRKRKARSTSVAPQQSKSGRKSK